MQLHALPGLRGLDADGALLKRLATAFAQTVAQQRPLVEGPSPERALHTLRAAALELGADELQALCEAMQRGGPDAAQLARLDALLTEAQHTLERG